MEVCAHKFGPAISGWCTCEDCGKKMRERDVKKMMEQNAEPQAAPEDPQITPSNDVADVTPETPESDVTPGEGEEAPKKAKKEKEPKPEPVEVTLSSGKVTTGPTCTITCDECGAERVIKIQDKFQVTKCLACQKKALNKKRYESRKRNLAKKREAAKAEKAAAEATEAGKTE